ncbi:hypothetical protein L6259_01505 [Candidatus Parcubacteria bacterium]|nr:hypothetical protein [Patescibacteria group bacterium]MCG2693941.1 hypothetical protein [Candidatus Parcubacteria bacterium]
MSEIEQKSIEQYFSEYGINDPDEKIKLLPELTRIVYDRNMHAVWYEKADDAYKKSQYAEGLKELDGKIKEMFDDFLKNKKEDNELGDDQLA